MIKGLSKENKYVLACSFGPDSMALLDMLIKEKYDIVVAHVNYHKRDISNDEQHRLKQYCQLRNIPFELCDTAGMVCDDNFQKWARNIRYRFFKEVLEKYKASAVLVAHQQDDLIETFIMQKNRNGFFKYWGIAEKNKMMGIEIIRPLLAYSKADLLKYDIDNNVPYSIDISNFSDDYERNRIRHEIVEKMSLEDRGAILKEIKERNSCFIKVNAEQWSQSEFLELSDEEITRSISDYLEKRDEHIDLSKRFIDEIRKAIKSKKTYVSIKLTPNVSLVKDYDEVGFNEPPIDYCYQIDEGTKISDENFDIDFTFGKEERNITASDYPLTIKPVNKNDYVKVGNNNCQVRRLFIDWKLPHRYRQSWPGIYNKDGKLIYIPRYRKDFIDNHRSKFVIKFTK